MSSTGARAARLTFEGLVHESSDDPGQRGSPPGSPPTLPRTTFHALSRKVAVRPVLVHDCGGRSGVSWVSRRRLRRRVFLERGVLYRSLGATPGSPYRRAPSSGESKEGVSVNRKFLFSGLAAGALALGGLAAVLPGASASTAQAARRASRRVCRHPGLVSLRARAA